jgi:hypothetical protein
LSSSEDSETLATATDVVDTLPNEATDEWTNEKMSR